jgi:type IV pilus assembly protein PilA
LKAENVFFIMNQHNRRKFERGAEAGFTLMELLIVMAIIIIIMTVAIPSFLNLRKQADETSAMQSVRAIHQAEIQYNTTYPQMGFSCNLPDFGGTDAAGPPSPTSAHLLPIDLASGQKAGYTFAITNCTKVNVNGQDTYTSYNVTAVPQAVGKTGNRGFCSDMGGEIMADPSGGTNCTVPVK